MAQARAVLLALAGTIAASAGCEAVSGLNGLVSVDCLSCESGLRSDSSSEAGVLDSAAEGEPGDSGSDVSEPDAPGSDAARSDVALSDADAESSDADAEPSATDAACSGADRDCGTCLSVHDNGLGEKFSDCAPRGTYDLAQATEACAAHTGNALQCSAATCGAMLLVCSSGAPTSCACWGFLGVGAGHVTRSGQPGASNCICPGAAAPSWN